MARHYDAGWLLLSVPCPDGPAQQVKVKSIRYHHDTQLIAWDVVSLYEYWHSSTVRVSKEVAADDKERKDLCLQIGLESDGLFIPSQKQRLASGLPVGLMHRETITASTTGVLVQMLVWARGRTSDRRERGLALLRAFLYSAWGDEANGDWQAGGGGKLTSGRMKVCCFGARNLRIPKMCEWQRVVTERQRQKLMLSSVS